MLAVPVQTPTPLSPRPLPFTNFKSVFDPSHFPAPPGPPLPSSADLFKPSETTDFFGFLNSFALDYDHDTCFDAHYPTPQLHPAPAVLPRPASRSLSSAATPNIRRAVPPARAAHRAPRAHAALALLVDVLAPRAALCPLALAVPSAHRAARSRSERLSRDTFHRTNKHDHRTDKHNNGASFAQAGCFRCGSFIGRRTSTSCRSLPLTAPVYVQSLPLTSPVHVPDSRHPAAEPLRGCVVQLS